MFSSLTKREKRLLHILFWVVVAVLLQYLLLIPALQKRTELEAQLSETTTKYKLVQSSVENATNTAAQLISAQAALKEAEKGFTPFLYNEQIDRLLGNMARKEGLKTISMEIQEYNTTMDNEAANNQTSVQETLQGHLKMMQLSLTVTGERTAFWNFLNAIQREAYLQLEHAAISNTEQGIFYRAELLLYMPTQ